MMGEKIPNGGDNFPPTKLGFGLNHHNFGGVILGGDNEEMEVEMIRIIKRIIIT